MHPTWPPQFTPFSPQMAFTLLARELPEGKSQPSGCLVKARLVGQGNHPPGFGPVCHLMWSWHGVDIETRGTGLWAGSSKARMAGVPTAHFSWRCPGGKPPLASPPRSVLKDRGIVRHKQAPAGVKLGYRWLRRETALSSSGHPDRPEFLPSLPVLVTGLSLCPSCCFLSVS